MRDVVGSTGNLQFVSGLFGSIAQFAKNTIWPIAKPALMNVGSSVINALTDRNPQSENPNFATLGTYVQSQNYNGSILTVGTSQSPTDPLLRTFGRFKFKGLKPSITSKVDQSTVVATAQGFSGNILSPIGAASVSQQGTSGVMIDTRITTQGTGATSPNAFGISGFKGKVHITITVSGALPPSWNPTALKILYRENNTLASTSMGLRLFQSGHIKRNGRVHAEQTFTCDSDLVIANGYLWLSWLPVATTLSPSIAIAWTFTPDIFDLSDHFQMVDAHRGLLNKVTASGIPPSQMLM